MVLRLVSCLAQVEVCAYDPGLFSMAFAKHTGLSFVEASVITKVCVQLRFMAKMKSILIHVPQAGKLLGSGRGVFI